MKLLVYAHTPPPHHGQSYMVQLMLTGFGGDRRQGKSRAGADGAAAKGDQFGIECYHVNARLSQKLEDIGDMRVGKFALLLGYCLQAIWCRFRYGVRYFYYIPAPGKPSALYRDWLVMFLCRPFFPKIILHWHAAGLAKWLEQVAQMRSRSLTFRLLQRADLSIVLSQYNRADAEKIFSKNITVVGNGIPDPCPDFEHAVLPRRHARFAVRKNLLAGRDPEPEDIKAAGENPRTLRILYIAHCTRAKGVFDAIAGVTLANRRLREQRSPLSMRLIIAGTFVSAAEKAEFELLQKSPEINDTVEYLGFVSGDQKDRALRDADLFCFPTYYENENQPVNLIEAMAYGLPILTTRWRSLPELFPADYAGLVDIRSPQQIADAIPGLMTSEAGDGFRQIFLGQYTLEKYLAGLAGALKKLDAAPAAAITGEPVKAA